MASLDLGEKSSRGLNSTPRVGEAEKEEEEGGGGAMLITAPPDKPDAQPLSASRRRVGYEWCSSEENNYYKPYKFPSAYIIGNPCGMLYSPD